MNRHAPVVKDLADGASSHLPQVRAVLGQSVQKFGQHLVSRNQADVAKRLVGTDYLRTVLIVWMKYCTPVERVGEDQPHFFFGAPWR